MLGSACRLKMHFYPRPPGGGRRGDGFVLEQGYNISIHALRVEGDGESFICSPRKSTYFYPRPPGGGRHATVNVRSHPRYFYPRPPGGGRHPTLNTDTRLKDFYPRPPGGGRQQYMRQMVEVYKISIHALRVEGDFSAVWVLQSPLLFLSTPSGWRATAKTDKIFVCFCAKGGRICLFKTRKDKNLPVAF